MLNVKQTFNDFVMTVIFLSQSLRCTMKSLL